MEVKQVRVHSHGLSWYTQEPIVLYDYGNKWKSLQDKQQNACYQLRSKWLDAAEKLWINLVRKHAKWLCTDYQTCIRFNQHSCSGETN